MHEGAEVRARAADAASATTSSAVGAAGATIPSAVEAPSATTSSGSAMTLSAVNAASGIPPSNEIWWSDDGDMNDGSLTSLKEMWALLKISRDP